jgi:hypothetical protein
VTRAIDVFAVLLLVAASAAFALGVRALGSREDFRALYLLAVGAFALRGSTELLRPRGGST